jgi:nucleoside-diphosphate-sugar epimerase
MTDFTLIVTGGSGFIGSNLLDMLVEKYKKYYDVKIISIDKRPPDKMFDDVEYIVEDLADPEFKYINEKPRAVIHLAGSPWSKVKGDQGWLAEADNCFYNNTVATYNVLSKIRPEKIIFSSSANIYGQGRRMREIHPIQISSPYGYSKWVCEEEIRKSGIEYVIYRFGTVIGIRGRTFPNRLVYCAVHGIPIELFNNGKAYRDLISVHDICRALISAIYMQTCEPFENTYNVSMGMEVSGSTIAEIVARTATKYGYKLDYSKTPFAPNGYVLESTLNIEKIYKRFGWKPEKNVSTVLDELFKYYVEPDAKIPPAWESL